MEHTFSLLEFGLPHHVTWKLSAVAGAEGEEEMVSVGPVPSGRPQPPWGTKQSEKARQELEQCSGEGGQLLEAGWGCVTSCPEAELPNR